MIVIVCGLPGTGKTTFAQALARRLGATHINSDKVRHSVRKRGQYDLSAKRRIYEEMRDLAIEALVAGQRVILDATFSREEFRRLIYQDPQLRQKKICYLLIEAKEEVIRQRLRKKRAYSEADYDVYRRLKEEYDPLEFPHLTLDTSHEDIPQLVEEALAYLNPDNHEKVSDRQATCGEQHP